MAPRKIGKTRAVHFRKYSDQLAKSPIRKGDACKLTVLGRHDRSYFEKAYEPGKLGKCRKALLQIIRAYHKVKAIKALAAEKGVLCVWRYDKNVTAMRLEYLGVEDVIPLSRGDDIDLEKRLLVKSGLEIVFRECINGVKAGEYVFHLEKIFARIYF